MKKFTLIQFDANQSGQLKEGKVVLGPQPNANGFLEYILADEKQNVYAIQYQKKGQMVIYQKTIGQYTEEKELNAKGAAALKNMQSLKVIIEAALSTTNK